MTNSDAPTPAESPALTPYTLRMLWEHGNDLEPQVCDPDTLVCLASDVATTLAAKDRELAEQRAELTGGLSDLFKSIHACYDTPVDHYREMARRLSESRDELKHENRKLSEQLASVSRRLAALDEQLTNLAADYTRAIYERDELIELQQETLEVEGPVFNSPHGVSVRSEADARLIAAAPDLLEALKKLIDGVDEYWMTENPGAVDAAKAAIGKAEGRLQQERP